MVLWRGELIGFHRFTPLFISQLRTVLSQSPPFHLGFHCFHDSLVPPPSLTSPIFQIQGSTSLNSVPHFLFSKTKKCVSSFNYIGEKVKVGQRNWVRFLRHYKSFSLKSLPCLKDCLCYNVVTAKLLMRSAKQTRVNLISRGILNQLYSFCCVIRPLN